MAMAMGVTKARTIHDSKRQRVPSLYSENTSPNIQLFPALEGREEVMDIDVEHQNPDAVLNRNGFAGRDREGKVVESIDLSPCHICRRKPTLKHELEQFASCERCAERTCYVCIRECLGMASEFDLSRKMEKKGPVWHHSTNGLLEEDVLDYVPLRAAAERERVRLEDEMGKEEHRGRVCSRCCRERGCEGEVWCLGCLGVRR